MDECARSLATLLADNHSSWQQEHDHAADIIQRLYLADVVTRMWDESRLGHVVEELIIVLRKQRQRSAARFAWALRKVMEPGAEEDEPDKEVGRSTYWDGANAILEDYERWRTESPATSADALRRGELLVRLFRAVTARESAGAAVERIVELVAAEGLEEESEILGEIVAVGAPFAPARAKRVVARMIRVVEDLLQDESANLLPEQRELLRRWTQFADEARERGQAGEALEAFLAQLAGQIGLIAWLLAREFLNATGLRLESGMEFDALVTRLRLGEGESDTRKLAAKTWHRLYQLHVGRLRDRAVPEEAVDLLVMLHALLWPASAALMLQLLATDVDRTTAFSVADAFAGSDRPNLIDMVRTDGGEWDITRMALWHQSMRQLRPASEWVASRPPPTSQQAGPSTRQQAERHERMFLTVPKGEQPWAVSSPVDDET